MRGMSSASKSNKNHYETLKVKHNATQEEIKSSYYKLSKQYHPDVNNEEGAKKKFRDISEAYEIVGNYKFRRQYDRGMTARGVINVKHNEKSSSSVNDDYYDDNDDDKNIEHMAFYKSRMRNYPKPVRTANSKIYNFDEWTRAHYGDSFQRTVLRKQKNIKFQEKMVEDHNDSLKVNEEITLLIGMATVIFLAVGLLTISKHNYDNPTKNDNDNVNDNNDLKR